MAEWASSSVVVRRSWGWWRCRWRGGFIWDGASGKHMSEAAARSDYLQKGPYPYASVSLVCPRSPAVWWGRGRLCMHLVWGSGLLSVQACKYRMPMGTSWTYLSGPLSYSEAPQAPANTRFPSGCLAPPPVPACLSGRHSRVAGLDALGISSARRPNPIQKPPTKKAPIICTHFRPHCTYTQFQQPRS